MSFEPVKVVVFLPFDDRILRFNALLEEPAHLQGTKEANDKNPKETFS